MDNASDVSPGSVERMLYILQTEGKELARFLADEQDLSPSELIHSLFTAKVITTAHVKSILTLDHTTHDKYTCLLEDVEAVIAVSISNGSSDDTAMLVKNFIRTLLDNNLHRIATRLHPKLAASNNGSDTIENGSALVPADAPHFYTYDEFPNELLGFSTNPPYPSRPTEYSAFPFTPTLPSSASAAAAAQSSSEADTSYFTASSGDTASPHLGQSKSYPTLGNGQIGAPCRSALMLMERECASDGNIPNDQAMGLNIVVEYNKKVFGPMDDESSDNEKYRNSSKPRGLVFIANYASFKNGCHTFREGSDVDVKNLHSLFEKMGYVVPTICQDMTKGETLQALRKFRDDERHNAVHSCVVIIMSHGKDESSFYTADGLSLSTGDVLERFSNRECKSLIDKPKLFILQYCRGDRKDMGVPPLTNVSMALGEIVQTDSANKGHTNVQSNKPTFSDMLLIYSTVEGYVSYRDPRHGSWLIQALCEIFMEHACNCSLDQLHKKVSKLVSSRESKDGRKQSCEIRSIAVTKDFYFNPTATFDETRPKCVSRDGIGGGGSMVDAEANGSLAVGAGGGVTNSSTGGSLIKAEDPVVASPGRLSSQRNVLEKQPLDNSSNSFRKELNTNMLNSDPTFKDPIDSLPLLPNNYDIILKACPSPGVLDSSCKLSGRDEEGGFDDSGISSNSSDFSSFGGGAGGSISSIESSNLGRKSSTVMTEPNGSGLCSRHAERSFSSSSDGDVCFLPPECFIRRESEVSVSLDIGVEDLDVDSLVLRSIDDSLMDA